MTRLQWILILALPAVFVFTIVALLLIFGIDTDLDWRQP